MSYNNDETIKLVADDEVRLDKYISSNTELSRADVLLLIDKKNITLNGNQDFKKKYILKKGDIITIKLEQEEIPYIEPRDIPIDIVYEDEYLLVVNKQRGLVVHPSAGHYDDTLVNALVFLEKDLSESDDFYRPGIVHRIDKDTSGLLLVAKNKDVLNDLAKQFKDHSIKREYRAIVNGILEESSGELILPIGRDEKYRVKMAVRENGKYAKTNYQVLETYKTHTYLKLRLETGRTHQIRVHMAYINHPVAGDPLYGKNTKLIKRNGQILHAKTIGFTHPITKEYMEFDSELPEYFVNILEKLNKGEQ